MAESKIWVRKVRLVSRVQLATKALKFEVPPEAEVKLEEERRECKLGDSKIYLKGNLKRKSGRSNIFSSIEEGESPTDTGGPA